MCVPGYTTPKDKSTKMKFTSIVAIAVVLTLIFFGESEGHQNYCPPHWTGFKSKCFRYYSKQYTWIKAKSVCERLTPSEYPTATLASVSSQDEQDFLYNYWLASRNPIPANITYSENVEIPGVWIGFNDIDSEGQFEWTDNSEVTYTNWLPHEPNNCCGGEDASHFWDGPTHFGGWNDVAKDVWVFPSFCQITLE